MWVWHRRPAGVSSLWHWRLASVPLVWHRRLAGAASLVRSPWSARSEDDKQNQHRKPPRIPIAHPAGRCTDCLSAFRTISHANLPPPEGYIEGEYTADSTSIHPARHMVKRTTQLLLILDGLLLLVVVAIGVRSHWVSDCVTYGGTCPRFWLWTENGWFSVYVSLANQPRQTGLHGYRRQNITSRGFSCSRSEPGILTATIHALWPQRSVPGVACAGGFRGGMWNLKGWWIVGILSVFPVVEFIRRWRNRRFRVSGVCIHCGYDLRASRERCPECGEPMGQKT